jgi:hypothetical protein
MRRFLQRYYRDMMIPELNGSDDSRGFEFSISAIHGKLVFSDL